MTNVGFLDSIGRAGEEALDTVVGGGAVALDVVRNPRRGTGGVRRRGARVTQEVVDDVEDVVDEVLGLPERVLHVYLRGVRGRARRGDVIGSAARTLLGVINGPAHDAARFFERLERETQVKAPRRRTRAAQKARTATRRTAGAARRPGRAAASTRRANAQGRTTTRGRGTATRARRSA